MKGEEKDTVDNMEESSAVNRREHVRTDDRIAIYYELLDENTGMDEGADWEIMFNEIEPRPGDDPRLYELIFDINQKLNMLINYMASKTGFNLPEAKEVNISGGGLRFRCGDRFKPGDKLVLKLFLPTYTHALRVIGEVVWASERKEGDYEVAIKYMDLDEKIRDRIIRYIFAKQRMLLRSKKGISD